MLLQVTAPRKGTLELTLNRDTEGSYRLVQGCNRRTLFWMASRSRNTIWNLNEVGSQMEMFSLWIRVGDLPCEFLVSPTLEFVIVGLVVRLLRLVKDGLPN